MKTTWKWLFTLSATLASGSALSEDTSAPCYSVREAQGQSCESLKITVDDSGCSEKQKARMSLAIEKQSCDDKLGVAFFMLNGELHSAGFEPRADTSKIAAKKEAGPAQRSPASSN